MKGYEDENIGRGSLTLDTILLINLSDFGFARQ